MGKLKGKFPTLKHTLWDANFRDQYEPTPRSGYTLFGVYDYVFNDVCRLDDRFIALTYFNSHFKYNEPYLLDYTFENKSLTVFKPVYTESNGVYNPYADALWDYRDSGNAGFEGLGASYASRAIVFDKRGERRILVMMWKLSGKYDFHLFSYFAGIVTLLGSTSEVAMTISNNHMQPFMISKEFAVVMNYAALDESQCFTNIVNLTDPDNVTVSTIPYLLKCKVHEIGTSQFWYAVCYTTGVVKQVILEIDTTDASYSEYSTRSDPGDVYVGRRHCECISINNKRYVLVTTGLKTIDVTDLSTIGAYASYSYSWDTSTYIFDYAKNSVGVSAYRLGFVGGSMTPRLHKISMDYSYAPVGGYYTLSDTVGSIYSQLGLSANFGNFRYSAWGYRLGVYDLDRALFTPITIT